jgi:hypothetical protein
MAVCGAVLLKLGLPATFTLTVNWSLEVAQPSRSWIGPAPEQGEIGEAIAIGHLASKVVPVEPDEITEARADCAVSTMAYIYRVYLIESTFDSVYESLANVSLTLDTTRFGYKLLEL